jgi:hypothetical protein
MDKQHQRDFSGNIQKALNSTDKVDANKVLQEAFDTTKAKRKPVVGGLLWASLVTFAAFMLVFIIAQLMNMDTEAESFNLVFSAVQVIIWTPLLAGIQFIALRNVISAPAVAGQVFDYLKQPWSLIATALIAALITQLPMFFGIPMVFAMLWALFFQITFVLNLMLVAGAKVSPLNGAYYSFLLISKRFFGIFIIHLALFLLAMLSLIPAIIGMALHAAGTGNAFLVAIFAGVSVYLMIIWVMPTFYHAIAICYRDILGINKHSSTANPDAESTSDSDEFRA